MAFALAPMAIEPPDGPVETVLVPIAMLFVAAALAALPSAMAFWP